jgi:hypothetical protein
VFYNYFFYAFSLQAGAITTPLNSIDLQGSSNVSPYVRKTYIIKSYGLASIYLKKLEFNLCLSRKPHDIVVFIF